MLITVDAGNTNITLGVFKEKKVYATFRNDNSDGKNIR